MGGKIKNKIAASPEPLYRIERSTILQRIYIFPSNIFQERLYLANAVTRQQQGAEVASSRLIKIHWLSTEAFVNVAGSHSTEDTSIEILILLFKVSHHVLW